MILFHFSLMFTNELNLISEHNGDVQHHNPAHTHWAPQNPRNCKLPQQLLHDVSYGKIYSPSYVAAVHKRMHMHTEFNALSLFLKKACHGLAVLSRLLLTKF
jgi:hypothetical protein